MHSIRLKVFFFIVLFCKAAVLEAGYDYKFDAPIVPAGQYEAEVSAKLTRGVVNTIYGWTEIFRTPARWVDTTEHGKISAVLIGVPYGLTRFVGRTVVGIYEILTCYAPQRPIFEDINAGAL